MFSVQYPWLIWAVLGLPVPTTVPRCSGRKVLPMMFAVLLRMQVATPHSLGDFDCFCWNRCNFYGQNGQIQRELCSVLPWWCHQNQFKHFTQVGFFSRGVDSYNPRYQLYLEKGEDQLLGGRTALPVVFNLQITTTKSFSVTFKVSVRAGRLWAEGPNCLGLY